MEVALSLTVIQTLGLYKKIDCYFFLFFYFFGDIKTQIIENGHSVGIETFPLRVKRETDELSKKQGLPDPVFSVVDYSRNENEC